MDSLNAIYKARDVYFPDGFILREGIFLYGDVISGKISPGSKIEVGEQVLPVGSVLIKRDEVDVLSAGQKDANLKLSKADGGKITSGDKDLEGPAKALKGQEISVHQ